MRNAVRGEVGARESVRNWGGPSRIGIASAIIAMTMSLVTPGYAATITVTSTGDSGGGSLRAAMIAAMPGDSINFSVSGTIALLSTLPTVAGSLTITGPTTSPGITIDGGGTVRVMEIASGETLNLKFLTIAHGFVTDLSAQGGAIFVNSGGTVTIGNCTLSNNQAIGLVGTTNGDQAHGGAIYNNGTVVISNSTVSNNLAQGDPGLFDNFTDSEGGAIENNGTITISNSTFSGNKAEGNSSGAIQNAGTLTLTNSTFYGNEIGAIDNFGTLLATNCTFMGNTVSAALRNGNIAKVKGSIFADNPGSNCNPVPHNDSSPDPFHNFDEGYNISDDGSCAFTEPTSVIEAAGLDAGLKDNGGPTQTVALLSSSPAINAIPHASCTDQDDPPNQIATDQRGFARPAPEDGADGACDIGAYEFQLAVASPTLGANAQLFGLLADSTIQLARSSTVSFVSQSPTPPEVGADMANIAGPTSQLGGDLIISAATGQAISLGAHDTVVGNCVTGGGGIVTGAGTTCASIDTGGTSGLLTTLSNAQSEASTYATYLAGLTTTRSLGNITLAKGKSMTVKLVAGVNVVAIGNITTAGNNTITLSAPKNAVVVVNVSGALSLGTATQIFTNSGGLNQHNLIWNLESANPRFGASVTFNGTLLNIVDSTTVTFGAGSAINGAVLTDGSVVSSGAMHLNFWPFTAAPADPSVSPCSIGRFGENLLGGPNLARPAC
jgi:hypothetical protein